MIIPVKSPVFCFICLFSLQVFAATFTVAKDGSGQYSTIMAAINVAGPGDVVRILDVATYPEQVTIDSTKNGLTLTSKNPTAMSKPRILWRDTVNVGPKSYAESLVDTMITYQKNGALRILYSREVTVNGIEIDGDTAYCFGFPNVLENQYPSQYGNTAVVILHSGNIVIRNCYVIHGYYGIFVCDRNDGGLYSMQADTLLPRRNYQFSQVGKTGNHIFESNRIHHNSFGLFFEHAWDLGSTIRYNLIYENHHYSDAFATEVKAKTSEGANQPGGAMMFRDDMLSPLAIYNNTFWHNFLELIGHWKTGYQHLVFNNIFGAPYRYLQVETIMSATYMDICRCLPNRMNNCVFAAHMQAPVPNYVSIFNGMNPQFLNTPILPGAIITSGNPPFPASAEIRWLEIPFLSTNEASTNFLTPDWSDTLVLGFIIDKGWATSGILDPDGSPADLGAIPQGGGMPVDFAAIIPTAPVQIAGDTATVTFALSPRIGKMTSPTIKLHRWISNLPYDGNSWSSGWTAGIITSANITDIPTPSAPVFIGPNTYSFTLPVAQTTDFAFLELIVEGDGSDGKPYTSTGFLPYRKMPGGKIMVELLDPATQTEKTEVVAGDTVSLKITAFANDNTALPDTIRPISIALVSGFPLSGVTGTPFSLPGGIPPGGSISQVLFTRLPPGGYDQVKVAGMWTSGANGVIPLLGVSGAIRIQSGSAQTVQFQNPPSIRLQVAPPTIEPGIPFTGQLNVIDRFSNRVDQPTTVNLSSLSPSIGDIVGTAPVSITTDSTGSGIFQVEVTNGSQGQIFMIRADLPGKLPDTAYLKVGSSAPALTLHRYGPLEMEYVVTFYDLKGRTVLTRVVRSTSRLDRPECLASQSGHRLSHAVYLVRVVEKNKLSGNGHQRIHRVMIR